MYDLLKLVCGLLSNLKVKTVSIYKNWAVKEVEKVITPKVIKKVSSLVAMLRKHKSRVFSYNMTRAQKMMYDVRGTWYPKWTLKNLIRAENNKNNLPDDEVLEKIELLEAFIKRGRTYGVLTEAGFSYYMKTFDSDKMLIKLKYLVSLTGKHVDFRTDSTAIRLHQLTDEDFKKYGLETENPYALLFDMKNSGEYSSRIFDQSSDLFMCAMTRHADLVDLSIYISQNF